jgi:hypothetical protein
MVANSKSCWEYRTLNDALIALAQEKIFLDGKNK